MKFSSYYNYNDYFLRLVLMNKGGACLTMYGIYHYNRSRWSNSSHQWKNKLNFSLCRQTCYIQL